MNNFKRLRKLSLDIIAIVFPGLSIRCLKWKGKIKTIVHFVQVFTLYKLANCQSWTTCQVSQDSMLVRTVLRTVVDTLSLDFKFEYHHVSDNYRFSMVFHNTGVFSIPFVFHSKYIEMFRYFSDTLYARMYIQDAARVSLLVLCI